MLLGRAFGPFSWLQWRIGSTCLEIFPNPNAFCYMVCCRALGIQQKHFSCPGTDPKLMEGSNSSQSCSKGPCDITRCGGVARSTSRFLNRCQTCHLLVPFLSLISLIKSQLWGPLRGAIFRPSVIQFNTHPQLSIASLSEILFFLFGVQMPYFAWDHPILCLPL